MDSYALLPAFWHGMLPEAKKRAATIFASHDSTFSVECVKALTGVHGFVMLPDMQNLRLCLQLAEEDPSHLERGLPEAAVAAAPAEVLAAQARQDITHMA